MNKITYFGDGQNTDFAFSFNFFQKSDIMVEINGIPQKSGYTLTTITNTKPADMPYIGGTITFNIPPKSTDTVTICRSINPERVIDYQATEKLDPETLNQDFNFLIEVIKDCRNAIDDFDTKYADFTNTPDFATLVSKLDATKKHLDLLGPINNIATKDEINALQNATSFTLTGIATILTGAGTYGGAIGLNFLGVEAGEYSYTAEKTGFISLIVRSATSQMISCVLQEPNSSVKASIYSQTLVANNVTTIMLPISQGTTLHVTLPAALTAVNFQRLFPLKGVR